LALAGLCKLLCDLLYSSVPSAGSAGSLPLRRCATSAAERGVMLSRPSAPLWRRAARAAGEAPRFG